MDSIFAAIGQYFWQTILYSCIIALIIEAIIRISRIKQPLLEIKLRSLSLWLPIIYLPLLYLIYPARNSAEFRHTALFDSNQWLELRIWGDLALWHIAAEAAGITVIFFIVRELVPLLGYWFGEEPDLPALTPGQLPAVDIALEHLIKATRQPAPEIWISSEPAPAIYTLKRRALVISKSAIELLDTDELEAALAHEFAHLSKENALRGRLLLTLRLLMFYNPVALLVYHRIDYDTERLCDEMAVSFTGRRLALASGLLKILRRASDSSGRKTKISLYTAPMEERAHLALGRERAARLLRSAASPATNHANKQLAVTAGLLMALLSFIV